MRFKTIVLEKKHIFAVCAVVVLACVGTGIAMLAKQPKTMAVFSHTENYDEILSQGLPQGEEQNFIKDQQQQVMKNLNLNHLQLEYTLNGLMEKQQQ